MSHVITAQKASICATCGEQVIPGDRILLQGMGAGRIHLRGATMTVTGRSSHEDCAPVDPIHAPHISWEQAENLLEIIKGVDLPTDDVNLRRLIAACRAAKRTRHLAPKREATDPALPMSEPYMEAYRTILKLTGSVGEWWRPYSLLTGQRWTKPKVTPEQMEAEKAAAQHRAMVRAMMEKHMRRA